MHTFLLSSPNLTNESLERTIASVYLNQIWLKSNLSSTNNKIQGRS